MEVRKNRVVASNAKAYNALLSTEADMESTLNLFELSQDYSRIEEAVRYLQANYRRQPELGDIASAIGLSEFHFQRLFSRWAGISPKRFLQFLTREGAKELLSRSASLLDTTYAVGLSSPGRLHDLFVTTEAVTPGEFKMHGEGLEIRYGFHPSPFGECLMGLTDRGICFFGFVETSRTAALRHLRTDWARARLIEEPAATGPLVDRIFSAAPRPDGPLPLFLSGTNFQIKVWEALLRIPSGQAVSYQGLAAAIGNPAAARAVGNAVAHNHIALLIPCHRVLRGAGEFGKYRYGTPRKIALLAWENARMTPELENG
jgi:AraC family transcriptional regulator of adaptative response/methylated-DNA-[protein]-cysteine methyltransferase